jgi:hypothetical protein
MLFIKLSIATLTGNMLVWLNPMEIETIKETFIGKELACVVTTKFEDRAIQNPLIFTLDGKYSNCANWLVENTFKLDTNVKINAFDARPAK